ncbi:MAG: hypothetical protein CBD18_08035 [Opitutales bacterium TMED158]|nr:MAG: hypothetical protein CBD18_08035 [Opitutales bacterium TMED158]
MNYLPLTRNWVTLIIAGCLSPFASGAENLYVLLDKMRVKDGKIGEYLEVEEVWSTYHKTLIRERQIESWSVWRSDQKSHDYATLKVLKVESEDTPNLGLILQKLYPAERIQSFQSKHDVSADAVREIVETSLWKIETITKRGKGWEKLLSVSDSIMIKWDAMTPRRDSEDEYLRIESGIFKGAHQLLVDEKRSLTNWSLIKLADADGPEKPSPYATVHLIDKTKAPPSTPLMEAAKRSGYRDEMKMGELRDMTTNQLGLVMGVSKSGFSASPLMDQIIEEEVVKATVLRQTNAGHDKDLDTVLSSWVSNPNPNALRNMRGKNGKYSETKGVWFIANNYRNHAKNWGEDTGWYVKMENEILHVGQSVASIIYDQLVFNGRDELMGKSKEQRTLVKEDGQWKIAFMTVLGGIDDGN